MDISTDSIKQREIQGERNYVHFAAIALILLVLVTGAIWYGISIWLPAPQANEDSTFTIEEGSGVSLIAQQLKDAGLVRSEFAFKMHTVLSGQTASLQAGDYTIPANSTLADIARQLSAGSESTGEVRVTIIEGWKATDVVEALQEAGFDIDLADLDNAVDAYFERNPDSVLNNGRSYNAAARSVPGARAEGYLHPDTYNFFTDATADQIVTRLIDHFEEEVTVAMTRAVSDSPYTFFELLNLASIVEKEVSPTADRKVVAGIFLERLGDNYPLQSDATVNYVTGKGTTQPTFADTEIESPYNTYAIAGLPLTPISNPSIDALQATLEPIETEYYFFLTTPAPENRAVFSRTFEEHLQNKNRYYP